MGILHTNLTINELMDAKGKSLTFIYKAHQTAVKLFLYSLTDSNEMKSFLDKAENKILINQLSQTHWFSPLPQKVKEREQTAYLLVNEMYPHLFLISFDVPVQPEFIRKNFFKITQQIHFRLVGI